MAKMRDAPIFFALVQTRFNALLSIENYIAPIQDTMRKAGYADFSKGMVINVNIGPAPLAGQMPIAQPLTLFQFLNEAKTAGFVLHQTALTFQTTNYEVFEEFTKSFFIGLKTVDESVGGLSFSERVGIRYLDAICPHEGKQLSDYLAPSLMGLTEKLNGRKLAHSMSETRSTLDKTTLVCRAVIKDQEGGVVEFPPDLQPTIFQVSEKFRNVTGRYAILDTDNWSEDRQKFDIGNIQKSLVNLHADVRRTFNEMVTPHALKAWG